MAKMTHGFFDTVLLEQNGQTDCIHPSNGISSRTSHAHSWTFCLFSLNIFIRARDILFQYYAIKSDHTGNDGMKMDGMYPCL